MPRRIVFSALGILVGLVAGFVGNIFFSRFFLLLFPILVPVLGYFWGWHIDVIASKSGKHHDVSARHAYMLLGFPLGLIVGVAITSAILLLIPSSGPYYGAAGPGIVCVLVITPLLMLILPIIGYRWGKQQELSARAESES